MKSLVLYDSTFGNTRKIAETICSELGEEAAVKSVSTFQTQDLSGVDLLVIGSPIIAWKPSVNMGSFLSSLKADSLKGIKAAAFDTRMKVGIFTGDARNKISKRLQEVGAEIIAEPKGFYVKDKEGPLENGEIEKAQKWTEEIKLNSQN